MTSTSNRDAERERNRGDSLNYRLPTNDFLSFFLISLALAHALLFGLEIVFLRVASAVEKLEAFSADKVVVPSGHESSASPCYRALAARMIALANAAAAETLSTSGHRDGDKMLADELLEPVSAVHRQQRHVAGEWRRRSIHVANVIRVDAAKNAVHQRRRLHGRSYSTTRSGVGCRSVEKLKLERCSLSHEGVRADRKISQEDARVNRPRRGRRGSRRRGGRFVQENNSTDLL